MIVSSLQSTWTIFRVCVRKNTWSDEILKQRTTFKPNPAESFPFQVFKKGFPFHLFTRSRPGLPSPLPLLLLSLPLCLPCLQSCRPEVGCGPFHLSSVRVYTYEYTDKLCTYIYIYIVAMYVYSVYICI